MRRGCWFGPVGILVGVLDLAASWARGWLDRVYITGSANSSPHMSSLASQLTLVAFPFAFFRLFLVCRALLILDRLIGHFHFQRR